MARPTLAQACRLYPHRYTMEHRPAWAQHGNYRPQYRTDAEWYAHTTFPGEAGHLGGRDHCYSTGETWPLGMVAPR